MSQTPKCVNILDLVLASNNGMAIEITHGASIIATQDSYHPPLKISVSVRPMIDVVDTLTRNFRRADYGAIKLELSSYDSGPLHRLDVDGALDYFTRKLTI